MKAALLLAAAACSAAPTLVATAPATAQSQPDTSDFGFDGTIGSYRIGMTLAVQGHRDVVGGHYFYASKLTDIPLSGGSQGDQIVLREPGGGTFRLQLRDKGRVPTPYDIDHATELVGTWTSGTKTLPVRLGLGTVHAAGGAGDPTAGGSSSAPYEAVARRFLHGVLSGDRAEAASAVHYPLRVNAAHGHQMIANRAQLLARWSSLFTPGYVAALRQGVPHDMFVRNGQAMVGNGAAWFDERGAVALNIDNRATPPR